MSEPGSAAVTWMRADAPGPARERLRTAVRALTRARRLQCLVDHAFAGLTCGLAIAAVAVAVARQAGASALAWQLAGALVVSALAVALALGWWRRPDALTVAIDADLQLRLKQRLSTAWEIMSTQGSGELTDRLARQALRAGLPARPNAVFPLRINRWGWVAPLAATALLLAVVVDLDVRRAAAPAKVDEHVVRAGERLGSFGREMQARAERDRLPHSGREGAQLERLGAHMQSGDLDREQALGQLGRMAEAIERSRAQALADAKRPDLAARRGRRPEAAAAVPDLDPGAMLERVQRGAFDAADARALSRRLDDIARAGVPRQRMEKALAEQRAGADEALRDILEKLAQMDRALKEDKELSNALEQLRRARDNLGGKPAAAQDRRGATAAMDWDDDERADRDNTSSAEARTDVLLESPGSGRAARAADEGDTSPATERVDAPVAPEPGPAGRVLRPEGQVRAGEDFSSEGRMLPRTNRPNARRIDLPQDYAAQVEAVLAREQYPEHRKALVRRYFLNLSQGARTAAEPPATPGNERE